MIDAEKVLAARLLWMSAEEFGKHGCNDMDPEYYFDGFTPAHLADIEARYNAWNRGQTGERCGDVATDYVKLAHIGDNMWMAYLSAVVGRKDLW